jgi:hypothetical protein
LVGSPVSMAIGLVYVGMAATIPFIAGLFGFSRRIAYLTTVILTCGLIYLNIMTFSDELKYQTIYRLLWI